MLRHLAYAIFTTIGLRVFRLWVLRRFSVVALLVIAALLLFGRVVFTTIASARLVGGGEICRV